MADVFVSFLWHHHQPSYREGPGGSYAMPWVRLHAIQSYYGMARLAQQHPDTHLTFNLVPSLLIQLDDYAHGRAEEEHLRLTAKPAGELSGHEVAFILDEFFHANRETMIRPHERYGELLRKRRFDRRTATAAAEDFSTQDLLDLQVWATLAWFFPQLQRGDGVVAELVAKERHFTEDDKGAMLARQRDILSSVVGMYRQLQDQGSAELSVSPFYHPILPLLCNMARAREALPSLSLPRRRADLTDDARTQLSRAVEAYREAFGREPRGLWPPEGSVSPEVVELAAEGGFRWLATDEGILARSLGCPLERDRHGDLKRGEALYQPYRVVAGDAEAAIIFRDRAFSDRIGFHYYHRPGAEAADDLVRRLLRIGQRTGSKDAFVAIILDGENAWEHYRDGGVAFPSHLYARLSSTPGLHAVTVSEYLDAHPPTATLPRLASGSWINADFSVWIGHEEDRRAWEALADTRRFLVEQTTAAPRSDAASEAWEELYIAEGSDWFWWYGDDRTSANDAAFDRLFRGHLQNVYRLLGQEPPASLDEPIGVAGPAAWTLPQGFMELQADGRATDFFEWLSAGMYDRARDRGVMNKQSGDIIRRVYFGFSKDELYLRVDTGEEFVSDVPGGGRLVFSFLEPHAIEVAVAELHSSTPQVLMGGRPPGARAAAGKIFEVACRFDELGLRPRDSVRFTVRLFDGDKLLERAPRAGAIGFTVPTADFEHEMWQV